MKVEDNLMKYKKVLGYIKKNHHKINAFVWDKGKLQIDFNEGLPSIKVLAVTPRDAAQLMYHSYFAPGSLSYEYEKMFYEKEYVKIINDLSWDFSQALFHKP